MRSMYKVALAVFALALAVCALGTGSALAAPEWYTATGGTGPEWQQGGAKLTKAVPVKWKGNLLVTDEKPSSLTEKSNAAECEDSGEGSVGPGAADEATKWTLSNCVPIGELCQKVEHAGMEGELWHSELAIRNNARVDVITGKRQPGFFLECKTVLGTKHDTCTAKELTASVSNTTGGVNEHFEDTGLYCSQSGKNTGKLVGTQLIEATSGGTLEVTSGTKGPIEKLTKSLEVKGSSELTIEDTHANLGQTIGVTCPAEVGATLEVGGKARITNYRVNGGCKPLGICSKLERIETNYPWVTELYESEGSIVKDRFVSGGEGKEVPKWSFECSTNGGLQKDICSLQVSPQIINVSLEGNVLAKFGTEFGAETKTYCSLDPPGYENGAVWRGEFTLDHPASVEAILVATP
jgi:hypothetical protein